MSRRSWLVGGCAVLLVVAVIVVLSIGRSSGSASPTAGTGPDSAVTTPSGPLAAITQLDGRAAATVAMGDLSDPANTFWELFVHGPAGTDWTLATPPGVADNGGLVAGLSSPSTITAGFLPSGALTFSPLATSADDGTTWAPGQVPGALAAGTDAVAVSPTGWQAAVLADGSAAMAPSPSSAWHLLAGLEAAARPLVGCAGPRATAVAFAADERLAVGVACPKTGRSGVLIQTGPGGGASGWMTLPGFLHQDRTDVIRLEATSDGVVALVSRPLSSGGSALVLGQSVSDGPWQWSEAWPLSTGWRLVSTGMSLPAAGSPVATVLAARGDTTRVVRVAGDGGPWTALPNGPAGAAAAVGSADGSADLLSVHGSVLTVWSTLPGATTWTRVTDHRVPIPFGSSG